MEAQGNEITLKNVKVGEPGTETKIGDVIYSIVPEYLLLRIKGSNYAGQGALIAISPDGGTHWYFNDASGVETLKQVLPDVANLKLPPNVPLLKLKDE